MTTILVTGFGPFPGAPFNPTSALAKRLAHTRRPALADVTVVAHVFATSYASVDRELAALLHQHRPDVLLMFGLHARAKTLRIETRARNALGRTPDVGGATPVGGTIAPGEAPAAALPAPTRRLLAAARAARMPAALSRDAGRYLCNYLCWRAAEATRKPGGPRLAAFVHVPPVRRFPVPRALANKRRPALPDLARGGAAILRAIASARR